MRSGLGVAEGHCNLLLWVRRWERWTPRKNCFGPTLTERIGCLPEGELCTTWFSGKDAQVLRRLETDTRRERREREEKTKISQKHLQEYSRLEESLRTTWFSKHQLPTSAAKLAFRSEWTWSSLIVMAKGIDAGKTVANKRCCSPGERADSIAAFTFFCALVSDEHTFLEQTIWP